MNLLLPTDTLENDMGDDKDLDGKGYENLFCKQDLKRKDGGKDRKQNFKRKNGGNDFTGIGNFCKQA